MFEKKNSGQNPFFLDPYLFNPMLYEENKINPILHINSKFIRYSYWFKEWLVLVVEIDKCETEFSLKD